MTTVARNNYLVGGVSAEGYLLHDHVPANNAVDPFNQGDLVSFDSSHHCAQACNTDTKAANLLGVAMGSSIVNSNLDNAQYSGIGEPSVQVAYAGIFNLYTTSGDTYNDGDPVWSSGVDAQTITNTVGSNANKVGCARLPINVSSIAGGAGIQVPVFVYSRYYVTFGN